MGPPSQPRYSALLMDIPPPPHTHTHTHVPGCYLKVLTKRPHWSQPIRRQCRPYTYGPSDRVTTLERFPPKGLFYNERYGLVGTANPHLDHAFWTFAQRVLFVGPVTTEGRAGGGGTPPPPSDQGNPPSVASGDRARGAFLPWGGGGSMNMFMSTGLSDNKNDRPKRHVS